MRRHAIQILVRPANRVDARLARRDDGFAVRPLDSRALQGVGERRIKALRLLRIGEPQRQQRIGTHNSHAFVPTK
ncbi:MAG: hypothetical protein WCH32_17565 [Pseudomonadota bacterium]